MKQMKKAMPLEKFGNGSKSTIQWLSLRRSVLCLCLRSYGLDRIIRRSMFFKHFSSFSIEMVPCRYYKRIVDV
jgi:hypothetical protein